MSGRLLEMKLRFQVSEGDEVLLPLTGSPLSKKPISNYIMWGKVEITDFEQKLALLDSKEDTEDQVETLINWNKVNLS